MFQELSGSGAEKNFTNTVSQGVCLQHENTTKIVAYLSSF